MREIFLVSSVSAVGTTGVSGALDTVDGRL